MKKAICWMLPLLALPVWAGVNSSDALVKFLNSRSAQSPKLYAEAAKIVREDADKGGVLQRFVIAVVSTDDNAPNAAKLDEPTRKAWLEESRGKIRHLAEKKDNPLAWFLLSMESNDMRQLERAAEGGNVQALNAWGTILISQALETPSAKSAEAQAMTEKGVECFKSAAGKKDANGLYNLGMCYMQALGCEHDGEKAMQCFRMAAEEGHPEAINNIGGCFRDGILVQSNAFESVKWFRKSADLGNSYGQLNYALALQRGEGTKRDDDKAAELLKLASEQGNAEAMDVYAMSFHYGRGVKQNDEMAFRWIRRSAEKGFPPAMGNLAECYAKGLGTPRDVMKSALWKMRYRAAQGDKEALAWVKENDKGDIK